MKQRFFAYAALCLIVTAMTGCNDPEPVPKPEPPANLSGRTILVYQVANNNLGTPSAHYDLDDISEMSTGMARGAAGKNNRLLVYNAGYRKNPVLIEVTTAGLDTLKTYSTDIFSVDSRRMLSVFDDMKQFAPADDYGLVLWSHGSGWLQDGISDDIDTARKRSFGSDGGRTMNVTTLARTIEQWPGFSWVYFDCCFMMTAETMYEMRRCAPYIVGSATELLVYGQPYHLTLVHLFSASPDGLVDAANETFKYYDEQFTGGNRTCTMSVVSTSGLDALASATCDIYEQSSKSWPEGYHPQRFENAFETSCRYFDFEDYVKALCYDGDNERFGGSQKLYEHFRNTLDRCVIYRAATPMIWNVVPIKTHSGLSTYILRQPESAQYRNYNQLAWYDDVASALKF